jgi:hypothetical protein
MTEIKRTPDEEISRNLAPLPRKELSVATRVARLEAFVGRLAHASATIVISEATRRDIAQIAEALTGETNREFQLGEVERMGKS